MNKGTTTTTTTKEHVRRRGGGGGKGGRGGRGKAKCEEGLCCGKAYRKCEDTEDCSDNKYPGYDKKFVCNDAAATTFTDEDEPDYEYNFMCMKDKKDDASKLVVSAAAA